MHFHFGRHGHRHHGAPRGPMDWARWGEQFEEAWSAAARGRGGGRRRMFSGDELRLILLALIGDNPRHGYDLIREIEDRTGGAYAPSPGVVYPTLTLLAEMGHIEERASEGAKKLYGITPAGEAHLAEHAATVTELMGRLAELGTIRRQTDRGPVRRAMRNLRTVLQNRLEAGDLSDEDAHQVAAILDEAVQRIERL